MVLLLPKLAPTQHNEICIGGYQMYAVEKWLVERNKPVTTLTVYTGDPSHKITVTALSLSPSEYSRALANLRLDGARPQETPHGTIMVTSLAHFRSDYTIVHIPDGDFLNVQHRLYANISLLRMGCSGRSALGLEEPSEAVRVRFSAMYHLPQIPPPTVPKSPRRKHQSLDLTRYPLTEVPNDDSRFVLEMVRILQASLAVFGLFPLPSNSNDNWHDGLLCDHTITALRSFVSRVAGPYLGLEPLERPADPVVVCALLSTVLALRNRLACIAPQTIYVPRDPFGSVRGVQSLLGALQALTAVAGKENGSPLLHLPLSQHFLSVPSSVGMSLSSSTTSSSSTVPTATFVTKQFMDSIWATYDKERPKKGAGENRRRLLGRLDRIPGVGGGGNGDNNSDQEIDLPYEKDSLARERVLSGQGSSLGGSAGVVSGAHLIHGLTNVARGVGVSIDQETPAVEGGLPGHGGGANGVVDGMVDLEAFIRIVLSGVDPSTKRRVGVPGLRSKGRTLGFEEGEDSSHSLTAGASAGDDRVAGSIRDLWSGRLDRMKEREEAAKRYAISLRSVRSHDTMGDRGTKLGALSDDGDEGIRSTEDEGDVTSPGEGTKGMGLGLSKPALGIGMGRAPWGGRVQRKIESWTKLSKKNKSVDLSSVSLALNSSPNLKPRRANPFKGEAPVSPTLRAVEDDDDLLSSGQVSPISEHKTNPFGMLLEGDSANNSLEIPTIIIAPGISPTSSKGSKSTVAEAAAYDKKLSAFNQKRPWGTRIVQNRITSWSDPVSARVGDEVEGSDGAKRSGKHRKKLSKLSRASTAALDEQYGFSELEESEGSEEFWGGGSVGRRSVLSHGAKRRHSFYDVAAVEREMEERGKKMLAPERMRIDVELCGQILIMKRREKHLDSVVKCLQALTNSLSKANASLRSDYHTHLPLLTSLDTHTKILSQIDGQRLRADMTTQETNTLLYESEQARLTDLWHATSPPRQKVFALREKVFGAGGRRLPPGKRGAHGRFNRVQWTLDGEPRLVDWLGRTESEEEEDEAVVRGLEELDVDGWEAFAGLIDRPEGEDEEVVENPVVRPIWLLRFFESWGQRWSGLGSRKVVPELKVAESEVGLTESEVAETGTTTSPAESIRLPRGRMAGLS